MCWDRRCGNWFDSPFSREVRRLYVENHLLVYAVVGHIMATMVFFDMLEKLSGGSESTWSPLRVMGPPIWLPLTTVTGKLMAAQTLVHSVMYNVACYYLVQARYRKNIRLLGPWIVMHCFIMMYQIVLVMKNRDDYGLFEAMLGLMDFPVVNVVLMVTAAYTAIHWTPRARPRRPAGAAGGAETQPLTEGGGYSSAETVVVTDRRWEEPPPPSYDVSISSPSHATGDSTFVIPENQGGAINVKWPWRWRVFREAAQAARAAEDAGTLGFEMQVLGTSPSASTRDLRSSPAASTLDLPSSAAASTADLRSYGAVSVYAEDLQAAASVAELRGSGVVAVSAEDLQAAASAAELQESGSGAVAVSAEDLQAAASAAELQGSGSGAVAVSAEELQAAAGVPAAEPQAPGRGARLAVWLGRWRWGGTRPAAGERPAQDAGAELHELSGLRRRSVGAPDPAAQQPLLQQPH